MANCDRLTSLGWEPAVALTERFRRMFELAGQRSAPPMRIGYSPYSASLSEPGDRRRFPYYAAIKGLDFDWP